MTQRSIKDEINIFLFRLRHHSRRRLFVTRRKASIFAHFDHCAPFLVRLMDFRPFACSLVKLKIIRFVMEMMKHCLKKL